MRGATGTHAVTGEHAFVGRAPELGFLRARLAAARGGQPSLTIVAGVAGIGKTALVARLLAEEDGVRALWATGDESETHVTFGVADQLLRAGGAGGGHVLAARDHVRIGVELLEQLGGGEPLAVVVDDAQWADVESLRALLFAARRVIAEPLLVVLVARTADALPEGLTKLAGSPLRLGPLRADELIELASALAVRLPPATARWLGEHTAGNPLHVRALLEELPPDAWRVPARRPPVPRSYAQLLGARLSGRSDGARRLVEAAAVLGRRSELGVAARLARLDDPLDALDEAVRAGLLVPDAHDGTVRFSHPLARAAVYGSLSPAPRARLHAAAAELMEDEAAALRHRVEAAPGADAALAAEAEAFARREADRGAWSSAVASLRAASRLSATRPERERRMLAAIDATLYGGDGAAARALAAETEDFADGPRRDAVLAYLAIYAGDAEEAVARLGSAWSALDPAADPELAATVAQRRAFLENNRLCGPAVVEWAERALALAGGSVETTALAATQRAVGLSLVGRRAEAHAVLDGMLAGGDSGFPLRSVKGAMLLGDDDLARARPCLRRAAEEARRIGSLVIAAQSLALLAKLEFAAGAWDDAVVLAEQASTLAAETDEAWVQAFARWSAQHVPLARGEGVPAAPEAGPRPFARIAEVCAVAAAERAAAAGAPEAVLRALEPVRGGPRGYWRWEPLYADALVALGRADEAAAFLDEQAGRWSPLVTARLERARGRLEAAAGRDAAAGAAFASALARLEPLGMPYELALAELDHGAFLRRTRRRRAAAERLGAARERFAALAARPQLERCDRELAACGARPRRHTESNPVRLTPQEQVVVRLVVAGLSNRRVAAELVVSERTVESHLTRVYRKLGVASRTELVARLARR